MKKLFEKIIEGVLACSGFVTSITIVLIILFLFSEALGLFNSRVIEEGYVLALNKDNKVSELTPAQIKDVFDEEITNWNEVGGQDMPIRLFRLEDITQYYTEEELGAAYEHAGVKITELVERTPGIIAFVPQQFIVRPDSVHLLQDNTISVKDVFAGAEWFPTATPAAQFGFLPLITGTLWVSLFAILIALPFGLSVAIYMSEVANSRIRNLLKPIIELLSGIPSVVYGFFGLIVIVPLIQKVFDLPVGESGSLNTDQQHTVFQLPFGLATRYAWNRGGAFQPYVGVKLGAQYAQLKSTFNAFETNKDTWGFYVSPEIGFNVYPWAYGPGLHFAAYYSYGTNKGDLFTYSVDGMNNVGLRIGIAF